LDIVEEAMARFVQEQVESVKHNHGFDIRRAALQARRRSRAWRGVGCLTAVCLLAGAGYIAAQRGDAERLPDPRARGYLPSIAGMGSGNLSTDGPIELAASLPNQTGSLVDGTTVSMSDAAVRGRVVSVSKGAGFVTKDRDGVEIAQVAFDDPAVEWKTVHVTLAVTKVLAVAPTSTFDASVPTVTFGITVSHDANFSAVQSAIEAMHDMVVLVDKSPVFAYAPNTYGTAANGVLIATVRPDGNLSLPFAMADEEPRMLGSIRTVTDLIAALSAPPKPDAK
jgi:hypothetical protein